MGWQDMIRVSRRAEKPTPPITTYADAVAFAQECAKEKGGGVFMGVAMSAEHLYQLRPDVTEDELVRIGIEYWEQFVFVQPDGSFVI